MNAKNTGRVTRFDAPQGPVARTNANPVRPAPPSPQIEREAQRRIAEARAKQDAARLEAGRAMAHDLGSAAHHDEGDSLSPAAALSSRTHGAFEARHQHAHTDGGDLSPSEALNARTAGAFERNSGSGR